MRRFQNQSILQLSFSSLVLAFGLAADTAEAGHIPLLSGSPAYSMADMLAPGAFIVSPSGRFEFDEFSMNAVPPDGLSPNPEDVFVTLSETTDTVILLFQIVGNNVVAGPDIWNMQLGYRATSLDGSPAFLGHTLEFTATGESNGYVFLNERINDENGFDIGSLAVYDNVPRFGDQSTDTTSFATAQSVVLIDKGLVVSGGTADKNGSAAVTHFSQIHHVVTILEPGTGQFALIGLLAQMGLSVAGRPAFFTVTRGPESTI